MKRLIALTAIAAVVLLPTAAFAVTPSEAVAGLDDGIYVEAGLSRDIGDLSASIARARNAGFGLYVVLLDGNPTGGAVAFADSVLNQIGTGTVLVLSASNEGMVSTEIDQATITRVLDAGFDAGGGDEGYVRGVVDAMTGTTAGSGSSGRGGGSGLVIMLVIIGGFVLLVWWAIRRSNKDSQKRRGSLVDEARSEIKGQLDAMANTILEIGDIVSASASAQDNQYLEKAAATFTAALESYETAGDIGALEDLSDKLDEARWELDAATAIAEGREVPPKPAKQERPACFFDPNHRDATEMVDITTATGTRTVRVCREDAERLKRGSQPQPRMIEVQGKRMPAPMAPRSHGGGGMDWLETFSVLAGGAGQAMSYDWGTRHRPSTTGRSSGGSRRNPVAQPDRARGGNERRRRG